jgi:hypothetical protein
LTSPLLVASAESHHPEAELQKHVRNIFYLNKNDGKGLYIHQVTVNEGRRNIGRKATSQSTSDGKKSQR